MCLTISQQNYKVEVITNPGHRILAHYWGMLVEAETSCGQGVGHRATRNPQVRRLGIVVAMSWTPVRAVLFQRVS